MKLQNIVKKQKFFYLTLLTLPLIVFNAFSQADSRPKTKIEEVVKLTSNKMYGRFHSTHDRNLQIVRDGDNTCYIVHSGVFTDGGTSTTGSSVISCVKN